jgi:hypothetical protein
MPTITSQQVGVALDMFGCPNRCRHCYLGMPPTQAPRMTEDDVRWVVSQFRAFKRTGEEQPLWRELRVSTWVREPDYSDDYRRLYKLEKELSDLPSQRAEWELLSVWRVARDADYARWAYSIGVRVCQISFFGLEKVTDWAHRRRGAFRDALIATERLLTAGIRPRWQWFFTKRIIPDLPGLIELSRDLRLVERCEALGGPFTLFIHCPSPDGEGWNLEHLRPTLRDLERLPSWLREQSEKHIGQPLGEPEGRLVHQYLGRPGVYPESLERVPPGNSVSGLALGPKVGSRDPFGALRAGGRPTTDSRDPFGALRASGRPTTDSRDPFGALRAGGCPTTDGRDPFGALRAGGCPTTDGRDPFGALRAGGCSTTDSRDGCPTMEDDRPIASSVQDMAPGGLWFFILPGFDVYTNFMGEMSPAFRLGNLKTDGLAAIVDALENDRPPGLHATFRVPVSELAGRFGRPRGRRIYPPADLKSRWARMYAESLRESDSHKQL